MKALIAAVLILCPALIAAEAPTTKTYQASDEIIANPERGFFGQFSTRGAQQPNGAALESLRKIRDQGMTMVNLGYDIPQFRETPLSPEFLERVSSNLSVVREAGMKALVRFAYNGRIGDPDATIERVKEHLDQLKPVLQANADVIAFVEAGFAGSWGEWHSSTNNFFARDPATRKTSVTDNTRALIAKWLEVLPQDRTIAIRTPRYKMQLTGDEPLTANEAYSGSPKARLAGHNDCLLATKDDMGTYTSDGMAQEKAFLHRDNLFVPMGGETCSVQPAAQPFIGCENALKEMAYMHYSVLNSAYHRGVLGGWETGGCMPEVKKCMGYRFRLVDSSAPQTAVAGGALKMSFRVANDGWANLYNPRTVEIVLRNAATRQEFRLPVKADPRRWMTGETSTVEVAAALPSAMPAGNYDVLLNLPDPAPKLKDRPEYSVRLANEGLWEPATGMNALQRVLKVGRASGRGN